MCSVRGHVAPAASASHLRATDRALGVELDDGTRLCRCLRCDAWVHTRPPGDQARYDVVPDHLAGKLLESQKK